MANPNADYPEQIHSPIDIEANAQTPLGATDPSHTEVHGKIEEEIAAIQTKLGIGDSPAADALAGQVPTKQANGDTIWDTPKYYQYIYNSAGAQAGNRFNNWADLITAINGQEARIQFEQDETIPAGSWFMNYVTWVGNGQNPGGGAIKITLPTGVTFSSSTNWSCQNGLDITSTSINPIITTSTPTAYLFDRVDIKTTVKEIFRITGNGLFAFGAVNGFGYKNGGYEIVNIEGADPYSAVVVFTEQGTASAVENNTLRSAVPIIYLHLKQSSEALSGFATQANMDPASFGQFSLFPNAKVIGFPQGQPSQFSADNVQDVLIELYNEKQDKDATLTSLAGLSTPGLLAMTAADTFAARTIEGATNQIAITNGGGIAGNPGIALTPNVEIATSLDIGGYGAPLITTAPPLKMSVNTNAISGVEMANINTGVAADFRFLIKDTSGHYIAFMLPSTSNTGVLFGNLRSTSSYIISNGGTSRHLTIGTVLPKDLIFGTNNTENMRLLSGGLLGIGTPAPTHALTLGSSATGLTDYLTADQTTNYERARHYWNGNIYTITTDRAGSGVGRALQLNGNGSFFTLSDGSFALVARRDATGISLFNITSTGMTAASGTQYGLQINPVINQSGTANYHALNVTVTETATGSGQKYLMYLGTSAGVRFFVQSSGNASLSGVLSVVGITNTGLLDHSVGSFNMGALRRNVTTLVGTVPDSQVQMVMLRRGFIDSIAAYSGQFDYFYNLDRNPDYTISSNYGTVGVLFNGNLTSNLGAPVASLAATPLVITIEKNSGNIAITDTVVLTFTGHRLGNDGAIFTDYKIEVKNTDNNWTEVLNRTGVTDGMNFKSVPLHLSTDTYPDGIAGASGYHSIRGIRVTVSGAIASSFSAGNLQLNSIQLRDSRPQFTPAAGLGAMDTRGGSLYGDISLPSTAGTKIGVFASQKLGFWSATPVVQPTTAVAAATVVANAGTAINDASTFDGYTIAKVVKALRNIGVLA